MRVERAHLRLLTAAVLASGVAAGCSSSSGTSTPAATATDSALASAPTASPTPPPSATAAATPAATPAPTATARPATPTARPTATPARGTATPTPRPATAVPTPKPTSMVVLATAVIGGQTDLVASAGGRTLYTYDSDVAGSGVSNCVNGCATVWPPLTVGAGVSPAGGAGVTGQVGTIRRADGSIQVTYGGRPLYAYSGDTGPGTTNGSYAGWSIARP